MFLIFIGTIYIIYKYLNFLINMSNKNIEHLIHKRSSQIVDNQPKLPTSEQIEYGEIAVNYAKGHETLSIKNSDNEIKTFSCDDNVSLIDYHLDEESTDPTVTINGDTHRSQVYEFTTSLNSLTVDCTNKTPYEYLILFKFDKNNSQDTKKPFNLKIIGKHNLVKLDKTQVNNYILSIVNGSIVGRKASAEAGDKTYDLATE